MNRQSKELLVESLKQQFTESCAAFLVGVQGVTVQQVQSLRRAVQKEGGSLKVAKNTLLHIAAGDVAEVKALQPHFKQQLAIVFVHSDAPTVARAIFSAKKDIEKLLLVAGFVDGAVIDQKQFEFIATLPSREQLLAHVCGTLASPVSSLMYVLEQIALQKGGASEQEVPA